MAATAVPAIRAISPTGSPGLITPTRRAAPPFAAGQVAYGRPLLVLAEAEALAQLLSREAGKPLNIAVHDHIIVGRNGQTSLRAKGVI